MWGILREAREISNTRTMCKNREKSWLSTQLSRKIAKKTNKPKTLYEESQDLPCSCQLKLNQSDFRGWTLLLPSTITTHTGLSLNTSTTASERYPSPPCLSKPYDALIMAISASLPPTPACSLYPRQNKQDSHSGFEENADCKDKPCLNSQEQKNPGLTFTFTF